jgi:hypothetical protein
MIRSWKTTVAGIVAAVAAAYETGVLETGDWKACVLSVALISLGVLAKDFDVGADPDLIARKVAEVLGKTAPGDRQSNPSGNPPAAP